MVDGFKQRFLSKGAMDSFLGNFYMLPLGGLFGWIGANWDSSISPRAKTLSGWLQTPIELPLWVVASALILGLAKLVPYLYSLLMKAVKLRRQIQEARENERLDRAAEKLKRQLERQPETEAAQDRSGPVKREKNIVAERPAASTLTNQTPHANRFAGAAPSPLAGKPTLKSISFKHNDRFIKLNQHDVKILSVFPPDQGPEAPLTSSEIAHDLRWHVDDLRLTASLAKLVMEGVLLANNYRNIVGYCLSDLGRKVRADF